MLNQVLESLDKLFEDDVVTLQSMLEIPDAAWLRLQVLAKTKNFELSGTELKTTDGKTLVTIQDENAWDNIIKYLEIEDIKDTPTRTLTPEDINKAVHEPSASLKQITIVGTAEELPAEDQVKEILSANLKPLNIEVESVKVSKDAGTVTIDASVTSTDIVKDEDVRKAISTNFDKVMTINNIIIK